MKRRKRDMVTVEILHRDWLADERLCPRCGTTLRVVWEVPRCPSCGYEAYFTTPESVFPERWERRDGFAFQRGKLFAPRRR